MFSDDDQSPLHPGGAGVIALVALLGGWLWVQDLPRSFREAEPPLHPAVRVLPDGVVDARLWQDPFSAMSEQLAGNEIAYDYVLGDELSAPTAEPASYRFLSRTWSNQEQARHTVLVGLLRGISGAEEAERRRRQRHAIVSALAVQRFEPIHGTSLGWVWYEDSQRDLRLPLFFELFSRARSDTPEVADTAVVLWLNEDQIGSYTFGRDPLAVISEIVATFLDPILQNRGSARERLGQTDVRIIGPSSSDSLRRFLSRESTDHLTHYTGKKLSRATEHVLGWNPHFSASDTPPCSDSPDDCEKQFVEDITLMIETLAMLRRAALEAVARAERQVRADDWTLLEPALRSAVDRHLVGWTTSTASDRGIDTLDLCRDVPEEEDTPEKERMATRCPVVFRELRLAENLDEELDGLEIDHDALSTILGDWIRWLDSQLRVRRMDGLSSEQWSQAVLHQWLLEWTSPKNALKSIIRDEITIHSSRATAPINQLTDLPPEDRTYLRSAVADDGTVLAAVVGELRHRGLDLFPGSDDHIVLISEWDTTYGRLMPELFHGLVTPAETCDGGCDETSHPNLHRFSYLRGLDGIVPRSPLSDDRPTERSGDSRLEESRGAALEPLGMPTALPLQRRQTIAFGRSQVDHVERIRRSIVRRDLELRQQGKGRVRAIGVLGSDFHDKQLILQVLRRQFRHALFFTTDLDARYFDPDKQAWNRNLLVGSSYGLTLRQQLQRDIPPFRDSYSTAAFVATRDALDEIAFLDVQMLPLVYEISRSGAIDLTPDPPLHRHRETYLHPPREQTPRFLRGWMWLALFVPFAFVVVTSITPGVVTDLPSRRSSLFLVLGMLVAILALLLHAHSDERTGIGEFVRWFDGVSVWPTEILRILVVGLAVWSFWSTRFRLRRAEDEIARQFFAGTREPEDSSTAESSRLRKILLFLTRSIHLRRAMSAACTPTPEAAWKTYRRLTRGTARWTRTLLYLGLATVSFFLVFAWFGTPGSPARGLLALHIDRGLQGLVILTVFIFTLWLFDATLLAWLFVRRIAVTRSEWSPFHLRSLAQTWGVETTDDVTEIAEIEVIALLTRGLWSSLGVPFLLVGLLVVSRSRFFDGWTWPLSLVVLFVAVLAIALASAVLLRLRAQRARREALRSLMEQSSQRGGDGSNTPEGRASVRQIELMAEAIRNERRGALGGWWASPLARTGVLVAVVVILMLLDLTYA